MLKWTDNAISCISDFINSAKIDKNTVKNYMNKLINYIDILNSMPELGKVIEKNVFKYEIRQIIYKKHKVIYYKSENDIIILTIIHTKMDFNVALKRVKRKLYKKL